MGSSDTKHTNWQPDKESFQLLLTWLDSDEEFRSQTYEQVRFRLISFFDRRHCLCSAELADQTFDRVTKWLVNKQKGILEGSSTQIIYENEPKKICYKTAHYVYQEWRKIANRTSTDITDLPESVHNITSQKLSRQVNEIKTHHQQWDCLDQCLGTWPQDIRTLLIEYYSGTGRAKIQNRLQIADRLQISSKNLTIRVLRYRQKLELCVKECMIKCCDAY